jgi:hypothetical protein
MAGVATPDNDGRATHLERCCRFDAEWQVTAAGFWTNMQMGLGAAAAGLAAVSSGSAFSEKNVLAGSLAAAAALAAAVLAALRPGERADAHQKAAVDYHALTVEVRQLRGSPEPPDPAQRLAAVVALERRAAALDAKSPWAPRRLAAKTRKFMEKGEPYFDNEGPEPVTSAPPGS